MTRTVVSLWTSLVVAVVVAVVLAVLGGMIALSLAALALLLLWVSSPSREVLAKRLGRTMLVAGSLLVLAVGLECVLLWRHARLPDNDYVHWTWGVPVERNSLGLREREFASPKPPGTFRVMVLGDSLTWGTGLTLEQRFTNRVEQALRDAFPDRSIEVLNFGVVGAHTVKERDLLVEHVGTVDPDLVVVAFFLNDTQPIRQNYAIELEDYRGWFDAIDRLNDVWLRRTAILLHQKLDKELRRAGRVPPWWDALDRTYDVQSAEWKAFTGALADIRALCEVRGLPPPLFAPLLHGSGDFNEPDENLRRNLRWNGQAKETAWALGFHTVDMEAAFRAQGARNRSLNQWDTHPGAESNLVYAETITAALTETLQAEFARDD